MSVCPFYSGEIPLQPPALHTLPADGKSFKLTPLCCISARLTKCTGLIQRTGILVPHSAPTLPAVQSVNHQSPMPCALLFLEQISTARYPGFLSIYPLLTPFLSLLLCGLDEGRVCFLIHHGSALYPSQCGLLFFTLYRWSVLLSSGHFQG